MQASDWIRLLQLLPRELHDGLSFVMPGGLEINMQGLIRLDEEFLVARGRQGGSTESDKVFFVPYNQIITLMFNRPTKEVTVRTWFEDRPAAAEVPTAAP